MHFMIKLLEHSSALSLYDGNSTDAFQKETLQLTVHSFKQIESTK